MIDFEAWVNCVDRIVCETMGSDANELTAPYSEMWQAGYSAKFAAMRAINDAFPAEPDHGERATRNAFDR